MSNLCHTTAKFRTTLYLSDENRDRLEAIPKGQRTMVINHAIAAELDKLEREQNKQELTSMLHSLKPIKSNEPVARSLEKIRSERTSTIKDY